MLENSPNSSFPLPTEITLSSPENQENYFYQFFLTKWNGPRLYDLAGLLTSFSDPEIKATGRRLDNLIPSLLTNPSQMFNELSRALGFPKTELLRLLWLEKDLGEIDLNSLPPLIPIARETKNLAEKVENAAIQRYPIFLNQVDYQRYKQRLKTIFNNIKFIRDSHHKRGCLGFLFPDSIKLNENQRIFFATPAFTYLFSENDLPKHRQITNWLQDFPLPKDIPIPTFSRFSEIFSLSPRKGKKIEFPKDFAFSKIDQVILNLVWQRGPKPLYHFLFDLVSKYEITPQDQDFLNKTIQRLTEKGFLTFSRLQDPCGEEVWIDIGPKLKNN